MKRTGYWQQTMLSHPVLLVTLHRRKQGCQGSAEILMSQDENPAWFRLLHSSPQHYEYQEKLRCFCYSVTEFLMSVLPQKFAFLWLHIVMQTDYYYSLWITEKEKGTAWHHCNRSTWTNILRAQMILEVIASTRDHTFAWDQVTCHCHPLQQQGAILRFEYHRKQQRKKFPKARCCKP